jgi:hypothetical protein
LLSFKIRKKAIESEGFERQVIKLLETLNTFTRIANDIKCDHKKELTPFIIKELK